jgi:hypothetical protein
LAKTGWINIVSTSVKPKTSMWWRWINMGNWLDWQKVINIWGFQLFFHPSLKHADMFCWFHVGFKLVDNSTKCKSKLDIKLTSNQIKCIYIALRTSADISKCCTETQPKTPNSKQSHLRRWLTGHVPYGNIATLMPSETSVTKHISFKELAYS